MALRSLQWGVLLLLLLIGSGCDWFGGNRTPTPGPAVRGDVNLAHLNFLVEDVEIAGQPMAITHIYSESPRYEWVDASGEGIAAVDDAARAAIVYLTDYESTGDAASLDKAR